MKWNTTFQRGMGLRCFVLAEASRTMAKPIHTWPSWFLLVKFHWVVKKRKHSELFHWVPNCQIRPWKILRSKNMPHPHRRTKTTRSTKNLQKGFVPIIYILSLNSLRENTQPYERHECVTSIFIKKGIFPLDDIRLKEWVWDRDLYSILLLYSQWSNYLCV